MLRLVGNLLKNGTLVSVYVAGDYSVEGKGHKGGYSRR